MFYTYNDIIPWLTTIYRHIDSKIKDKVADISGKEEYEFGDLSRYVFVVSHSHFEASLLLPLFYSPILSQIHPDILTLELRTKLQIYQVKKSMSSAIYQKRLFVGFSRVI